jgi:hypothetical protein
MMKEMHFEPLKGKERRKRADLDWVSEVVLLVDFVKLKLGQKGVVESGEHLGSIEKLAWRNIIRRLSPAEFLARTFKGNYEPIGFNAQIYEEREGFSALMVVKDCPYVSFWRKHAKGVGNLTEDDICSFCHATFQWLSEFSLKYEAQRTRRKCRMTLSKEIE